MSKNMLSKILVIGVFVLFIGTGVQPAFAVKSKLSVDTIENENDCNYKPISNIYFIRLDKKLDRLEGYIRMLSLFFKYNSEIAGICGEASNMILELRELNNYLEYNLQFKGPTIICDLLENIYRGFDKFVKNTEEFIDGYKDSPIFHEFLFILYGIIFWSLFPIIAGSYFFGQVLGCGFT
ncbi:MAG: hypothetical protein ACW964_12960 [Candidatus Hodarchaeales archaeon]|jgi:hypothetical protein